MGHLSATYNIGCMYDNGTGIQKNYKLAYEYYSKAAGLGHLGALNNLANLYKEGNGVVQNLKTAFDLYKSASKDNDEIALFNLACMYEEGIIVSQNSSYALKLFKKSSQLGDFDAKKEITFLYTKHKLIKIIKNEKFTDLHFKFEDNIISDIFYNQINLKKRKYVDDHDADKFLEYKKFKHME